MRLLVVCVAKTVPMQGSSLSFCHLAGLFVDMECNLGVVVEEMY